MRDVIELIVIGGAALVALAVVLTAIVRDPDRGPTGQDRGVAVSRGPSGEELEDGGGDGPGVLDR